MCSKRLLAVLLLLGLVALLWGVSDFSLIPLRWTLAHVGLESSYTHCPPSGNVDCDLATAILDAGCALVPAHNHDVGTWAIYDQPAEVWDRAGRISVVSVTFGVGDCGGVFTTTYEAFIEANGQQGGGPGLLDAQLSPDAGNASAGVLVASVVGGCTRYNVYWPNPADPVTQTGEHIGRLVTLPACPTE